MLSYYYKLVKGFVTMTLNPLFRYETDVEAILIFCIEGSCYWPPRADLRVADTIAGNADKLGMISDNPEMSDVESAMRWVATVAVKGRRVAVA